MDFVPRLLLDDLYCNTDVGKCSCDLSAITHIGPLMRGFVLQREKVMSEVLGCINMSNNFLLFTKGTILSVLPSTKFSMCPSYKVSASLW